MVGGTEPQIVIQSTRSRLIQRIEELLRAELGLSSLVRSEWATPMGVLRQVAIIDTRSAVSGLIGALGECDDLPYCLLVGNPQGLPEPTTKAAYGVVPEAQLYEELPRLLLRTLIAEVFDRCVRITTERGWPHDLVILRDALVRAYTPPPIIRPDALARDVGTTYKTLQRAWSRGLARGESQARTPLLQAVLFLRIVEQRLAHPEWPLHQVADCLGITVPTLEARYRQFAGCTASALGLRRMPALVGRLRTAVVPVFAY